MGFRSSVQFILTLTGILWAVNAPAMDIGLTDAQRLSETRSCLTIIDARHPSLYKAAHIPGAKSFYWGAHTSPENASPPWALHPPEELAAALTRMGIHRDTPLVVYGSGKDGYGGEGWAIWVLAYLGHQGPIRLLKGGLPAWQATKRPLSTPEAPIEPPAPTGPSLLLAYNFQLNPHVLAEIPDMDTKRAVPIDTRSLVERLGDSLPGARAIHWKSFFAQDGFSPLPPDQLKALIQSRDIQPKQPVIYFCTGGIRSAWAWLVHTLALPGTARNFEGGMAVWPGGKTK